MKKQINNLHSEISQEKNTPTNETEWKKNLKVCILYSLIAIMWIGAYIIFSDKYFTQSTFVYTLLYISLFLFLICVSLTAFKPVVAFIIGLIGFVGLWLPSRIERINKDHTVEVRRALFWVAKDNKKLNFVGPVGTVYNNTDSILCLSTFHYTRNSRETVDTTEIKNDEYTSIFPKKIKYHFEEPPKLLSKKEIRRNNRQFKLEYQIFHLRKTYVNAIDTIYYRDNNIKTN